MTNTHEEAATKAFLDINKIAGKLFNFMQELDITPETAEAVFVYAADLSLGVREPDPTSVDDLVKVLRSAYMMGRSTPEAQQYKKEMK